MIQDASNLVGSKFVSSYLSRCNHLCRSYLVGIHDEITHNTKIKKINRNGNSLDEPQAGPNRRPVGVRRIVGRIVDYSH